MDAALAVVGWLLWGFAAMFGVSGLVFNVRAARSRGSVSLSGLFQFAAMATLAIAFLLGGWDKLHLTWLIPACWIASMTPPGMAIGKFIGLIVESLVPR